MNTSIISGIIGGVASLVICTYISKKVRDSSVNGELKFNSFIAAVAWCCLAFSVLAFCAFFFDNDVWEKRSEFFSVLGLVIGFGIGAVYCFGEYFKVHGTYNEQEIQFYTPWTGKKYEKWENLKSVKFNSTASWYVLEFRSGAKIRLSTFLSGHGKVLELVGTKGNF